MTEPVAALLVADLAEAKRLGFLVPLRTQDGVHPFTVRSVLHYGAARGMWLSEVKTTPTAMVVSGFERAHSMLLAAVTR